MAHPILVEFLHGIIGDLQNLERLLIFADWLEENGDYRARHVRDLVRTYRATPDRWTKTWAASITLSHFRLFNWGKKWLHYITNADHVNARIVPFPYEDEHVNFRLEIEQRPNATPLPATLITHN